jgi:class 3 adenylate cyclase
VVTLLNGLFTRFDEAAHQLGIEKIKTVGDAYMAVCGMPVPVPDHAERIVRMVSRMESGGVPHSIQVTRPVYEKLKDEFVLEPRGTIEVKGKGSIGAGLLTL